MTRKKFAIITSVVLVLALIYGVYSIHNNYRLGDQLHLGATKMVSQIITLVSAIDYTQKEFAQSDCVDRSGFDIAILSAKLKFGDLDKPFLNEVTDEWYNEIIKFYNQTQTSNYEDFENTFRNEEIYIFRDKLVELSNILMDFYTDYAQTPEWKLYFISWKDAQIRLSDQARMILAEAAP